MQKGNGTSIGYRIRTASSKGKGERTKKMHDEKEKMRCYLRGGEKRKGDTH